MGVESTVDDGPVLMSLDSKPNYLRDPEGSHKRLQLSLQDKDKKVRLRGRSMSRGSSILSSYDSRRMSRSNSVTNMRSNRLELEVLNDPARSRLLAILSPRQQLLRSVRDRSQAYEDFASGIVKDRERVDEKQEDVFAKAADELRQLARGQQKELLSAVSCTMVSAKIQVAKRHASSTIGFAGSNQSEPLGRLFGISQEDWREPSLTRQANLDCTISPVEMRALELLRMLFFVENGDRINAFIAFRPSAKMVERTLLDPKQVTVGLLGVSPSRLRKGDPVGIVGLFQPMGRNNFDLYYCVLASLTAGELQLEGAKLPERTLRLFRTVHDSLPFEECPEVMDVVKALPTRLCGVQLQSPDDAIMSTFSIEPAEHNPFA